MIKLIDTLSYTNSFRSVSPYWKCAFAAALFLLASCAHPLVQALLAVWMLVWVVRYAGISLRHYLLLFSGACLFFIAGLPALLLEFSGTSGHMSAPLFEAQLLHNLHVSVTAGGLQRAGELLMRIFACLSTLFFLILTTPFPELLQVLKRLRVPQLVLELMLIMYRFIFVLADTASDTMTAQRARGGYAGFSSSLRDLSHLIVHLFQNTMRQYRRLSHGLISRGFAEEIRFAPSRSLPVPRRYQKESCVGVLLLIGLEIWIRWGESL